MARSLSWFDLKDKYELTSDVFLVGSAKTRIPTRWKTQTSNYSGIDERNLCQNHHVDGLEFCLPTNYPLRKYTRF